MATEEAGRIPQNLNIDGLDQSDPPSRVFLFLLDEDLAYMMHFLVKHGFFTITISTHLYL